MAAAMPVDEVIPQKCFRAPHALELRAEHPQREHVEQDVADGTRVVQEHVGDRLPHAKRSKTAAGTNPRNSCMPCLSPAGINHMQQEYRDVCAMSALIAGESGPGPNENDEYEGPRDG